MNILTWLIFNYFTYFTIFILCQVLISLQYFRYSEGHFLKYKAFPLVTLIKFKLRILPLTRLIYSINLKEIIKWSPYIQYYFNVQIQLEFWTANVIYYSL